MGTVVLITQNFLTPHKIERIKYSSLKSSQERDVTLELGITSYFSCSKILKVRLVIVLNFCDLSKLIREFETKGRRSGEIEILP